MNTVLAPASLNRGGNSWDYCFLSRKARTNAMVAVGFSSCAMRFLRCGSISSTARTAHLEQFLASARL